MMCLEDGMIQAWLDGELAPEERAAIEAHLDGCPACRRRLSETEASLAEIRAALTLLEPADVAVPDWTEIAGMHPGDDASDASGTRITWLQGVLIAAAAAAVIFALLPGNRPMPGLNPQLQTALTQLPPITEDPQRLWREQCVVVTVMDKSTGSIDRFITSATSDRMVRESFSLSRHESDNSSKPKQGI